MATAARLGFDLSPDYAMPALAPVLIEPWILSNYRCRRKHFDRCELFSRRVKLLQSNRRPEILSRCFLLSALVMVRDTGFEPVTPTVSR
jgi:hypothetical protein